MHYYCVVVTSSMGKDLRVCQHVTPMYSILQLSINAFDYNCHVDLIKLLKQEGELFSLRKARQRMSELFPLTEGWCMYDKVLDDGT